MRTRSYQSSFREWNLLGAMIMIALLARICYVSGHNFLYDDAYITLRYAENLVHGQGYVYNPGEFVFGASSPLYTFLMAGFGMVVSKDLLPAISQWMGTVCLFLCVIVFWKYMPMSFVARSTMVIGLLGSPRIFYSSIGGMEECLALVLMSISFAAVVRSSQIWQGVTFALLILTKVDTIVWIVSLVVVEAIINKRMPWFSLLLAGILVAPWSLYSLAVFGTIVPHTVAAKQVASGLGGINLYDAILLPVPDSFRENPLLVSLFSVAGYGSVGSALLLALRRREYLFLVFPLYCLAYTFVLFASDTPLGLWARWSIPLWASLVISFAFVVQYVTGLKALPFIEGVKRRVTIWSPIVLLIVLASAFVYPRRTSPDPVLSREVAEWLRDHAGYSQSVFLEPIGLIGYVSDLYIHDFIGLVSPGVTSERQKWSRSNRWFTNYVKEHSPSYVVLRATEIRNNEFGFGGSYGDGIFTDEERKWFYGNYGQVYESAHGPEREQLAIYGKKGEVRQP